MSLNSRLLLRPRKVGAKTTRLLCRSNAPPLVVLEGYGPLPTAARLALQRIDNVTYQPFDFAPLFHADEGRVRVPATTAPRILLAC